MTRTAREIAEEIWRTIGVPCETGKNPYNCEGCSYELGQIERALLDMEAATIERSLEIVMEHRGIPIDRTHIPEMCPCCLAAKAIRALAKKGEEE